MKIYLIEVDSQKIGVAKDKANGNGVEYFLRRDERTYNDFVKRDSMSLEKFNLLMDQLENGLNSSFSMSEVLEEVREHEHISLQEQGYALGHYYDHIVSELEKDLLKITIYYEDGGLFHKSVRGSCVVGNNTIRINKGGRNVMVLHFDGVRKISINGVDFYGKGE